MAKLTNREQSELRALADSDTPLWEGVPPHLADSHLLFYIDNKLVVWTGKGYRITDAGRSLAKAKEGGT
ncbi:hypothetical protein G6L30_17065 [Agrobacterium rhizogenes]|nr:hypothetical protein [Rhizobium rhizogenes]